MKQIVKVTAMGPTIAQAKAKAYAEIKKQYRGNVLVYGLVSERELAKPSAATTCRTENNPANGARKFITVHNIYVINPTDPKDYKFVERAQSVNAQGATISDKTTAVKRAKELALKHQMPYFVKVEKVLENEDDQITATITPNYKEGSWEFELSIETL